jgi:hypothetical protein
MHLRLLISCAGTCFSQSWSCRVGPDDDDPSTPQRHDATDAPSQAGAPRDHVTTTTPVAVADHHHHHKNEQDVVVIVVGGGDNVDPAVTTTTTTKCSICQDSIVYGEMVSRSQHADCDHLFHTRCIRTWLLVHMDCPLCRRNFLDLVDGDDAAAADDDPPGAHDSAAVAGGTEQDTNRVAI